MAPSNLVKQARKDARKNAAAAHQLAEWYAMGEEGLDRDLSLWLRWETEAAERGCADARFDWVSHIAQAVGAWRSTQRFRVSGFGGRRCRVT